MLRNKQNCVGCSACIQICPQKCISFEIDEEGFWYPEVNSANCIHCEMCKKICPTINAKKKSEALINCLVGYAKDNYIRKHSSSGGVFSILAKEIIKNNGVAYGASFDQSYSVHHIRIDKSEELVKLRGSKYLQSRIENTYEECKIDLENNTYVLFSGTPCQIAGLKNYLQKDYHNLYTVDILCHGVPSPMIWQKYLNTVKHNKKIGNINFRSKTYGWSNYSLRMEYSDGSVHECISRVNLYMRLFLSNICLRPSCYNCSFKSLNRDSDITLGDCWRINRIMPDFDQNKGTSIILIHSSKGKELINQLNDQLNYKQIEINSVLPASSDERNPVKSHPEREKFFKQINSGMPINRTRIYVNISILDRIRAIRKKINDFLN